MSYLQRDPYIPMQNNRSMIAVNSANI